MDSFMREPPNLERARLEEAVRAFTFFSERLAGKIKNAREKAVYEMGLRLSHAEEALAQGDSRRAEAHLYHVIDLMEQL